jgi:tetratricopeptide (TPR) repeat protein
VLFATPLYASDESAIDFGSEQHLADGAFALLIGNFDEGIRLTRKGLEAPPHYSDRSAALSNLCAGFVGSGDYRQAVDTCTSALELNEKNWQALNNRGFAYYKLGDLEAARRDIDQGLELQPSSRELNQVKRMVFAH